MTVYLRDTKDHAVIRTVFHWKRYGKLSSLFLPDFIDNILVFIPFGIMAGLLFHRYRVPQVFFASLFMSETIECSQLIWKRGVFDVDDLINNALGALIGGLLVMFVLWIKKRCGKTNAIEATRVSALKMK